ncbi:hypothetical protein ACFQMA_13440 [Halosimplex aquaticum]|uniref:DUF7981 domain-containing protein n=1 Tax=Halosimplex aquaticum TaxID=3026162 RepID=A0ABD5Y1P0_9EURY|nr:hypothetical protein [Halosimplex aquaticum]
MAGDESPSGDEEPRRRSTDAEPALSPQAKSSLLWGLVGGLSFLVLVQGYELVADLRVGFTVKFLVALAVAVGAAGLSHVTQDRLPAPDEGE